MQKAEYFPSPPWTVYEAMLFCPDENVGRIACQPNPDEVGSGLADSTRLLVETAS